MSTRFHREFGLTVTLLAFSFAFSASAKNADWPQIGYNSGHTGFNSSEITINSKNAGKLADTGSFTTGGAVLAPVIANGIIYVRSDDQNIYAWNLASGKLVWTISLPTLDGPNGMVIGDNILVATCGLSSGSGICAFNAKNGKTLWSYGLPNGGAFTAPVISGNTVYLGQSGLNGSADSYNMVAVNLKTGAQRWAFGPCAGNLCSNMGEGAPAVDKGMVYFGCAGTGGQTIDVEGVCAVNASTGALVWQYQLGVAGNGDDEGRLSAQDGKVYVAYQTALCNQCGYTIDVTALNGSTGAKMWDTTLTGDLDDSFYPFGAPAIGPDGSIYEAISTNNNQDQPNLFALNADGTLKWQVSTVPYFGAPPTIVGKSKKAVLFFACSEGGSTGTTCAMDARNGALLWESQDGNLASYDFWAPVVAGGAVYNGCNNNNLCTYGLK